MIRVLNVVGTRPNFIKIGALHHAFSAHPAIAPRLVHTGQHDDAKMSEVFFRQLEQPEPDLYVAVGAGAHAGVVGPRAGARGAQGAVEDRGVGGVGTAL